MAPASFQISLILPPSISGTASPPAPRPPLSSGLPEPEAGRVHRLLFGPVTPPPWDRTARRCARKFPGPVDRSQRSEESVVALTILFPLPPLSTSPGGWYQNSRWFSHSPEALPQSHHSRPAKRSFLRAARWPQPHSAPSPRRLRDRNDSVKCAGLP